MRRSYLRAEGIVALALLVPLLALLAPLLALLAPPLVPPELPARLEQVERTPSSPSPRLRRPSRWTTCGRVPS